MNGREKDHDQVGRDQAQILDAHHMFGIVLHLLKIAGADALAQTVRSANPKDIPGRIAKFAILLLTAFAASDAVPRPETRLSTAIFPSWNILFPDRSGSQCRGSFSAHPI